MAAHRYWRLRCIAHNEGGFGGDELILLTEIEMRDTPGGADQCTGGTAIGSDGYASGTSEDPPSAFDNNNSTFWQGWWNGGSDAFRTWIGYDFGAGNEKDIVQLSVRANGSYLNRTPWVAVIESSDDGVSWTHEWLVNFGNTGGSGVWASLGPVIVTKPTVQAANRYWGIFSFSRDDNNAHMACAELKFYEGGVDVTSGGTGVADSRLSGYPVGNAFDGNNSTFWHSNFRTWAMIGYDFGAGVTRDIDRFDLRARDDFDGQAPVAGFVAYSQDGISWLRDWGFRSPPTWATGELRSFLQSSAPAGKTRWRFLLNAPVVSGTAFGLNEIAFRSTPGGASESIQGASTGVGRAVAWSTGYEAPRAFDGITAVDSSWAKENYVQGIFAWFDFLSGKDIVEAALTARVNPYQNQSPTGFAIQSSIDDGLTWQNEYTTSGLSWSANETKVFTWGAAPSTERRRQAIVC